MADLGPSNLFAGDLRDPWVAALLAGMPGGATTVDLAEGWPQTLPRPGFGFDVVVLHRMHLNAADAAIIRSLREGIAPPRRILLCAGPQVRAADLDRWGALFDVVLPEATAASVLPRYVAPAPGRASAEKEVAVVAAGFETRQILAETCEFLGFRPTKSRDWHDAGAAAVALWDVPTLEPDWPEKLAQAARSRTLVVLLRFPDRQVVSQALAAGAAACLEWPCDSIDLAFTLDRVAFPQVADPPHPVPPPRMGRRARGSRRAANADRHADA